MHSGVTVLPQTPEAVNQQGFPEISVNYCYKKLPEIRFPIRVLYQRFELGGKAVYISYEKRVFKGPNEDHVVYRLEFKTVMCGLSMTDSGD
jgi:hypothetical protein